MDIRKVKESYKIYDNAFGYMQRIKALLTILDSDNAPYPSNYLLTIALRDLKIAGKKMSKCSDIFAKTIKHDNRNKQR